MRTIRAKKASFPLRLDPSLYRQLMDQARHQSLSMNQLCSDILFSSISTKNLKNQLVQSLVSTFSGQGLIGSVLFGSQARGTASADSDTDILLVFESQRPIQRSLYKLWKRDDVSIHCVSYPDSMKDLSSFWLEIALDGIILSDNQNSISTLLQMAKNKITSGEYIRKTTHGQPYWVKRPQESEL